MFKTKACDTFTPEEINDHSEKMEVFTLHMHSVNTEAKNKNKYCLSLVKPLHIEKILTLLGTHYTELLIY